jgi:hypothetical protein
MCKRVKPSLRKPLAERRLDAQVCLGQDIRQGTPVQLTCETKQTLAAERIHPAAQFESLGPIAHQHDLR